MPTARSDSNAHCVMALAGLFHFLKSPRSRLMAPLVGKPTLVKAFPSNGQGRLDRTILTGMVRHTDGYGTAVASRQKLLDAAIDVIRKKGYAATRVDDIAAYAGVTKGSFFHHFSSKEGCARAAAARWREQAEVAFSQSGYRDAPSPAARVLAYLDFRIRILEGPVESYACYAGTLVQEVHLTCPALAADCAEVIFNHAQSLEFDLAAALGPDACEASDLAFHIQATIQGALLMAKAEGHGRGARKSLEYLQQYLAIRMGENPR